MTQIDKPEPGQLTAEWFNVTSGDINPWILETSDPFSNNHCDAFLGNGLIGQRFGIEGNATLVTADMAVGASGCLKHGFWNGSSIMDIPKWAIFDYNDGKKEFHRANGDWRNYRQSLDMRTAILRTSLDWASEGQCTRLEKECFLSRSRPNIAVISMTLTPDFDGKITVSDIIDGTAIDDATDWRYTRLPAETGFYKGNQNSSSIIALDAKYGPGKKRLVVASMLVYGDNSIPAQVDLNKKEKLVSRKLSLEVTSGESYTLTKIVAIISDSDSPDPFNTAFTAVEGAAGNIGKLKNDHISAWEGLWQHRIEVPSYPTQRILNSCLFQLYSNMREGFQYSMGPVGLSGNTWGGRTFWDSDFWMFPGLALLNSKLAKGFVDYRYNTLAGAKRNALAEGYDGAMFAWESAETGDEVIPHLVYHHQHHVNSDIAIAQWWQYLTSGDIGFLKDQAAEIIMESARFWVSYADYNKELDRYEIRRVCCADEYAGFQDNNTLTNYGAVHTIRLAEKVANIVGEAIPGKWLEVAEKMWLPFDEEKRLYLEYEGYNGETIRQADTALLIYPYEMPMSDEIKTNIVDYYSSKYPNGNIMMGHAIDGIINCELGRKDHAWQSFVKLIPHFRMPFLLAGETPSNNCISFQTGLGGLLQLFLMGYAGIRMHDSGLFVQPCLPPEISFMTIKKLNYKGISFDLIIEGDKARVANADGKVDFVDGHFVFSQGACK